MIKPAARLRAILAVVLIASGVTTPAKAAGPDNSLHVKRPNLVVADMDRALSVYRDILGFSVSNLSTSSPQSYSYPVFRFPAEARLRFATLDTPNEVRALALTEVTGIDLAARPLPHQTAVVVRVADMAAVIARIQALGLATVDPRRAVSADGDGFIEQAFTDFDGHLIVLYQLVSGEGG